MPVADRGRIVVWASRRGTHLGQRSCASAREGRTYERKRSDHEIRRRHLVSRGPFFDRGLGVKRVAASFFSSFHTPGSRFFSRSTIAAALSAPMGMDLPMSTAGWPAGRPWPPTEWPSPRPEERTWQPLQITSCRGCRLGYAAAAAPQRNGSPWRQIVCRSTASLRASAARALFIPIRLASCTAQALGADHRWTRPSSVVAASNSSVRT